MFGLGRNSGSTDYLSPLLPWMILVGPGLGSAFVPATLAVTSGLPASEAGLASALIGTSRQVEVALDLAVVTTVAGEPLTAHGIAFALTLAAALLAAGVLLGARLRSLTSRQWA